MTRKHRRAPKDKSAPEHPAPSERAEEIFDPDKIHHAEMDVEAQAQDEDEDQAWRRAGGGPPAQTPPKE